MKKVALMISLFLMVVLAACGGSEDDANNQENANQNDNQETNENDSIEVDLENSDGESIGTANLEEVSEGVEVSLVGHDIPKGTHAFHIHEKGACEEPDFESAEGHFNPDDTNHGFDDADGPHAGDMPNIVVGDDGTVNQSYVAENVTLEKGEENSLLKEDGTALVIHEGADDGESQPSGDAGDRMACGVIEK